MVASRSGNYLGLKQMSRENIKQALISILIGAAVAFFTTLFEGLAEWLQQNAVSVVSGATTSVVYLLKRWRA